MGDLKGKFVFHRFDSITSKLLATNSTTTNFQESQKLYSFESVVPLYNLYIIKSYCVTAHNRTVRGGSSGSFFTQNMMEWEQKRQQGIQGISPSAFALAKHNEAKIFVKST